MTVVVTGSVAFDSILDFPGRFVEHILPDKLHILNVSFLVDRLTRHRGGTCGNIAYSLALLGERPLAVGTVGVDFDDYRQALERVGVDTRGLAVMAELYTAGCTIITDRDDNQITGFYPGAMSEASRLSLHDLPVGEVEMVVVAPNDPAAMARAVRESRELGWPLLYDPGMQLPRLAREDLLEGIGSAAVLIGNDYEIALIGERLGRTTEELLELTSLVVVTRGAQGALLLRGHERVEVPAAPAREVVDPTGAGDAFRAGLVLGLIHRLPLATCGRLGAVAAVYAVEHQGTQEHHYTWAEFAARYRATFGADPAFERLDAARRQPV